MNRIIISDDHCERQALLAALMQECGYSPSLSESGDLIFSPQQPELLAQVHEQVQRRSLPLLEPTAASSLEFQEQEDQFRELLARKEKDGTLQQEYELGAALLDSAPVAIIVQDREGCILHFNRYCEKVSGYTAEEAMGRCIWDFLLTPEEAPVVKAAWDRLKADGTISQFESHWQTKDGRLCLLSWEAVTIPDQYGEPEYTIAIALDITKRRQTDDELSRYREHLEELVEIRTHSLRTLSLAIENSPAIVVITDRQAVIEYVNPQFTQTTGYTVEEAIGQNPNILNAGYHSAEFFKDMWDTLMAGCIWRGVLCNRKKNGEYYWESTSIAPVRNAEGEISHYVAIKEDVTERKRIETELIQAKEAAETANKAKSLMFETMLQGVIHRDHEGNITLLNPAAERILGKTLEDFKNGDPIDEEHPTLREDGTVVSHAEHPSSIALHTKAEVRDVVLHVFNPKENAYRWINMSAVPLFKERETDDCEVYTIFDDITERKNAELLRLQTEIQARHAQKMESIGQLAAGIAHEINTPIQYVGDNIRFLKDAFVDLHKVLNHQSQFLQNVKAKLWTEQEIEEVENTAKAADVEYLAEEIPLAIHQSEDGVERVAKIVRAMKEFSHPGTTEKIAIDLNEAIDSTLTVCHNEWKYVAELVTDFDPTLPTVPCISGDINQAILNIVVNAAHAVADVVGDGGSAQGVISISTKRVGQWAEIRISDTGSGIPEHARSRVFDPFFTTKGVGKGTGQGLAIAHSVIVEKHGGTITFETESGRGTTFIIRLPLDSSAS